MDARTELEPIALPAEGGDWLVWVTERATSGLSSAGSDVCALKSAPAGDGAILPVWNDVQIALSGVFSLSSLMGAVHPDAAVMEAAESFEIEARRFSTDLYLDAGVFAQLSSLRQAPLGGDAERVLEDALRSFRRAGVDLDDETLERLRDLNRRESELSQSFSRGIRDGRLTTKVPASALAGLPEDYVSEHPADEDGQVEVTAASDAAGRREIDELLAYARKEGEEVIDFSNWRHHVEALKRDRFGVDSLDLRRYFDVAKVRKGPLDVTGRLFGLVYTPVEAPTWHAEVTSYDVALAENGQRLGRIHLDLHARDRTFNHAAQFTLVSGVLGRQLPEGVLVCNFSRGLMELDHVVTLFHEFGHLMHHVLAGRHEWVRFSGVATEWDFVEAPSQMAYAAISCWFHRERPTDLTNGLQDLMQRYSPISLLPDTHFHAGFGHLEGYTSAYYTYTWSMVIAKDLFSAFDRDNLFAPEVAHRYRDTVLAAGGSRDAADLVEDFLGRPYDNRAFKAWLETTPEAER